MSEARHDRLAAVLLLALAFAGFAAIRHLGAGSGGYPRAVLALLAGLSAILLIRSFLAADQGERRPFFLHRGRFLAGFGMSLAYVAGVGAIGFFPATALFFPGAAALLGYRDGRSLALATVLFMAALYGILAGVFGQTMPRGVLGD